MWHDVRRQVESHGMKLNNVGLRPAPEITLGKPGGDEHIDGWCALIRNMGAAGVPTLCYNFRGIGNFRTEETVGRGGAHYSAFNLAEFETSPPEHPDQHIGAADLRENLRHFLGRIVPVAEEANVLLTMHPDDPPRAYPLGGAARVLSSLDDFERMFALAPSPANAMLFCQGCVAEMGENIPAAILRIGALGKMGAVHFRNIRGTPDDFQEVFLDECDMDMFLAMQTYREVGFEGPFMLDHIPGLPQQNTHWAARGFAIGYIRAMIQATYR
jgi:mannonate dehydratase